MEAKMALDIEQIKRLHDSDYALLDEVDRICKKHNIQYFLHGGSFLGAVRHKDIIPWDDDVDLTFLRDDYEKFVKCFEEEHNERFKFIDHHDYPKFFDFIPKIADIETPVKNTYGHEDFYGDRFSYVTLDIFIIDEVGKNHGLQLAILKGLYGMAMGHRPSIEYSKYSVVQKIGVAVMAFVGKLFSMKFINRMYDAVSKWGNGSNTTDKLFLSNEQPHPHYWGLVFDKDMYDGKAKEVIRGKEFPAPGRSDDWLTYVYGDYMTIPPEKEQIMQHVQELEGDIR